MARHKLLGISGSLRAAATNRKLVREAARLYGEADYTEADLDLPLYNGDIEDTQGIPAKAQILAVQIAAANVVIISGPEYNGSISGVLKNALDWVSRTKSNPWLNKPVAFMSAAAGRSGGQRTQYALRLCLVAFRPRLVAGPEVALADSDGQFDAEGRLTNDRTITALTDLMQALRAEVGS